MTKGRNSIRWRLFELTTREIIECACGFADEILPDPNTQSCFLPPQERRLLARGGCPMVPGPPRAATTLSLVSLTAQPGVISSGFHLDVAGGAVNAGVFLFNTPRQHVIAIGAASFQSDSIGHPCQRVGGAFVEQGQVLIQQGGPRGPPSSVGGLRSGLAQRRPWLFGTLTVTVLVAERLPAASCACRVNV